jgi:malonyl-CoA O-methyltransferase
MINTRHARRRFERAAADFDAADFVHAETRQSLLERLAPLLIDAKTVVDLGAATGKAHPALRKRFKGARIIAVDSAHAMLRQARSRASWLSKNAYLQADATRLPLADGSVDVVFSNLLLPWFDDPGAVFAEVSRVLRKGGVFAFATLGPDSLQEIARAWREVDSDAHVHRFADMHDLGDGLINAGLSDPVLDVDRLTVSYENTAKLFADLTAVGGRNSLQPRHRGLTGKRRFAAMTSALATDGLIALDLELVYGHCWGTGPRNDPANFRIDANQIPIRQP